MEFTRINKYELKRIIGSGASGDVYEAYDPELNRTVALKIQSASSAENPQMQILFMEEPRKVASLDHPNIVKVYELGIFNNRPYFTMEFMSGGSLKRLLKDNNCFTEKDALEILRQIASALVYAHSNNLIHRDVKSENILKDSHGIYKITDFGIARGAEGSAPGMTIGYGRPIGTPEYMAPEQIDGYACPQSDLYSLGIILFEMLTGQPPFIGNDQKEIFDKHYTQDVPQKQLDDARVRQEVKQLIVDLLEKRLKDRVRDGETLVNRLNILLGTDQTGIRISSSPKTPHPAKRVDDQAPLRKWAFIISGLLVLTAIVLLVIPPLLPELQSLLTVTKPVPDMNIEDDVKPDTILQVASSMQIYGKWHGSDPSNHQKVVMELDSSNTVSLQAGNRKETGTFILLSDVFPCKIAFQIGQNTYNAIIDSTGRYSIRVQVFGGFQFPFSSTVKRSHGQVIYQLTRREVPPDNPPSFRSPVLHYPADKAYNLKLPVTLKWGPSAGALSYSIQIATTKDFISPVISQSGLTVQEFTTTDRIVKDSIYFWRVSAAGPEANSRWSKVRSFATGRVNIPPPTPGPIFPDPIADSVKSRPVQPPDLDIPPFALINGGHFIFANNAGGGQRNEMGNLSDSTPVETFKLNTREITQAEYEAKMGDNPSIIKGRNLPVTNVTWNQAKEYCKSIGSRLPTEAEWEYAAKTGTKLIGQRYARYPWGDTDPSSSSAVYNSKSPAAAGSRRQGNHGLFDMSGNVAEWCSDTYKENHYRDAPEILSQKVVKGGAYNSSLSSLRSSAREGKPFNQGYPDVGFRCAR